MRDGIIQTMDGRREDSLTSSYEDENAEMEDGAVDPNNIIVSFSTDCAT
jgi:hypothetical protein